MIESKAGDPGQDNLGLRVRTLPLTPGAERNYVKVARVKAREGQFGTVRAYSNSHGICYEVQHDDGSSAWYEPEELSAEPIDPEASTLWARLLQPDP